MSLGQWLAITIALLFVLYFTVIFIRHMVRRPSMKDLGTWIKNVMDSIFGIG
jgi:hypothetical protein